MKISCQSCQAKYTIADEKVVGKIVKIRCKKCGSTIVINGNEEASASGGGDAEQWTVNVADGDQRTMTVGDIVTEYRSGLLHDDTFCWKDGMNDWLPIREIESLHAAVSAGAAPLDEASVTGSGVGIGFDAPAEAFSGGAAPGGFGGEAYGAEAPASQPRGNGFGGYGNGAPLAAAASAVAPSAARRAGGRGNTGADLFGAVEQAGGEDDVMTSAPVSARLGAEGDQKLTGQRNENSVLFSLNSLTDNNGKSAAVESKTTASGDASGLIDIKALSAGLSGGGGGAGSKEKAVDDIMNLGGGGAFSPALAPALLTAPAPDYAAPDLSMPMDQPRSGGKGLLVGIIVGCAFLGAAILGAAYMVIEKQPVPVAPVAAPTDTASAAPTSTGGDSQGGSTDNAGTAPTASASAVAAARPQVGVAPKTGGGGGKGATAAAGGGGDSPAAPDTPKPPPASPMSLGAAMNAVAGGGATGGSAPQGGGASAPFDRGAAAASLGAIAGGLSGCKRGDGPTGGGHVKVTFQPNGNVSTAEVDPPFQGTAAGGCIAGKFRGAHVPAFSGAAVSVGKSFTVN